MRRLNVDNYAILYLVDEDHERVEIVRIPFGAMDLDKFFEEEMTWYVFDIVFHALLEVDSIEDLDPVTFLYKYITCLPH